MKPSSHRREQPAPAAVRGGAPRQRQLLFVADRVGKLQRHVPGLLNPGVLRDGDLEVIQQLLTHGLGEDGDFTTNIDAENPCLINNKAIYGALNRHFAKPVFSIRYSFRQMVYHSFWACGWTDTLFAELGFKP